MATVHYIPIITLLIFLSISSQACHPNDKKALLEIKKSLNNAYDFASWDPKLNCCKDWYIVQCVNDRVTTFSLSVSNLNLPLPSAIGDLEYLESLAFHNTNLTGQIPQAIAKLSRLRSLDLRQNHLTGPVPSFLSQLKNLDYIGLSRNNLTGSIPSSLSKLPKLSGLLLDRNKLTGPLPESFSQFQVQDFYLYLSHNSLTGPIPKSWNNANFTWIDISRNKLTGDISPLFGKNKTLQDLDLNRNTLEFDFSDFEIPETLRNLDLNHNRITGSLPKGLAKIDLISLNVSYNRLCGEIPSGGTGRLQELDYTAYFHNRCLCGKPLPACKK